MLKDGVLGASSPDARRRALSNAYPLVSDIFPVEHLSGILRWKVLSVVGVGIIAGIGGLWCVLPVTTYRDSGEDTPGTGYFVVSLSTILVIFIVP